jgi:hypothetical protein
MNLEAWSEDGTADPAELAMTTYSVRGQVPPVDSMLVELHRILS